MDDPFRDTWDDGDGIDLTPLIDVVFLLLVFFILAGTFMQPGLEVNLPAAQSAQTPDRNRQWIVVSIDADGRYHLEGEQRPLPAIMEILASRPGQAINFHVDRNTPFEAFVRIVDRLQIEGRDEFIVTTRTDEDES